MSCIKQTCITVEVSSVVDVISDGCVQTALGINARDAARCSPINTTATSTSNTRAALTKEIASSPATCAPGFCVQCFRYFCVVNSENWLSDVGQI